MWDLGTNALSRLWWWWCHIGDGIPLWNPYGAFFAVVLALAVIGFGIKYVLGKE